MDMKELDRRIKRGVREIKISPLFMAGKTYSLDTELEDPNGTLLPKRSHCWLTWESQWRDDNGNTFWSKEAYMFRFFTTALEAQKYLQTKAIE